VDSSIFFILFISQVPSGLELFFQESIDNALGHSGRDEFAAKAEDVRIVVLPRQFCRLDGMGGSALILLLCSQTCTCASVAQMEYPERAAFETNSATFFA
jgi:hypothetical protein